LNLIVAVSWLSKWNRTCCLMS
jgi:hypothetical protein